jgi:hypothetical protein
MMHAAARRLASEADCHGKIPPEAGHANHRKTNSYTPAPSERRSTHAGIPHGCRSRPSAKGHREQPAWPSGLDHSAVGLSPRLRVSELVDLRWDQIDFNAGTLAVRRAKRGTPATHPIRGDELRALRRLQREQDPKSPFVFTSERASPFTTAGFARLIERAVEAAGFKFKGPTRICYGTPAASPWPTRDMTPAPCRPISAIEISSTRFATPSWRRIGSRIFGDKISNAQFRPVHGGTLPVHILVVCVPPSLRQ